MLREYTFLRSKKAIYRVFGLDHPAASLLLLIRYYKSGQTWVKPLRYSAESTSGSVLTRYDILTLTVPQYGMTLGVGRDGYPWLEEYDPLAAESCNAVSGLAAASGCPVGLSGSLLVGLDTRESDVDVVLYGRHALEGGMRLIRSLSQPYNLAQLIAASSSLKRLASLANFDIPRLIERNAFKALIPWQGDKRKLDIHYSKADSLIRTGNLRLFSSLNVSSVRKLTVVDAGHRVYFPGYLLCKDEIGRSTRVWIVDHVMSFLLEGDSVTVRCKEVASDTEKELVGSKVVDVVLH